MALKQIYVCDACGKQKAEVNHWFIRIDAPNTFYRFAGYPWDDKLATDAAAVHYCGQACVTAAFQQWLDKTKEAA
jgi:hypothetical protein